MPSATPPPGTVVGVIRMTKVITPEDATICDVSRYSYGSRTAFLIQSYRVKKGSFVPMPMETTDAFHASDEADDFFNKLVKSKDRDGYVIVKTTGLTGLTKEKVSHG